MMRKRRGSNVIEFALTLPLFLAMIGMVVDYGVYWLQRSVFQVALNGGCREGAMVDKLVGDPVGKAQAEITNRIAWGTGAVSVSLAGDAANGDESLVCSIQLDNFQAPTGMMALIGLVTGGGAGTFLPTTIEVNTDILLEWQRVGG